jgi:nucleotide-binding universal stress UspA family protein
MKIQIKKILCASDLSDFSNITIPIGVSLARAFNADLYICHIVDLTATAIYHDGFYTPIEMQDQAAAYAEETLAQIVGAADVNCQTLIQTGHPADSVTRLAEEKKIDLVIAATHGRSGLKRLVIGSVTERLMRTLACPLLIVRSPDPRITAPGDLESKFKRILVGCDFSAASDQALQYGLNLAQELQSELHLVHVIAPAVYENLLKSSATSAPGRSPELREQLKARLAARLPEESYHWCDPKTQILAGRPFEEITKYAVIHKMDLIVLGARGLGLVEKLSVGSTTDRVARQAPCPLLSVGAQPGPADKPS